MPCALGFEQPSLFRPSMILTPTNRYGWSQGVLLSPWPRVDPLLRGRLRKFRGARVDRPGRAIAARAFAPGHGVEVLQREAIERLADL